LFISGHHPNPHFIRANRRSLGPTIKGQLHKNGAVVLRGFDLPKTADGFVAMHRAMGLQPCDDPLQSVRENKNKNQKIKE
jgi:hypothetical protein